jgi:hypothetical protein
MWKREGERFKVVRIGDFAWGELRYEGPAPGRCLWGFAADIVHWTGAQVTRESRREQKQGDDSPMSFEPV